MEDGEDEQMPDNENVDFGGNLLEDLNTVEQGANM